jgi:hypothetical protein
MSNKFILLLKPADGKDIFMAHHEGHIQGHVPGKGTLKKKGVSRNPRGFHALKTGFVKN